MWQPWSFVFARLQMCYLSTGNGASAGTRSNQYSSSEVKTNFLTQKEKENKGS